MNKKLLFLNEIINIISLKYLNEGGKEKLIHKKIIQIHKINFIKLIFRVIDS